MSQKLIFKICPRADWIKATETGVYTGSPLDQKDGFIHFSTREQVQSTLEKHFAGQTDLLLVAVDERKVSGHLKYELARNQQLFPHLYADLPVSCAVWVKDIPVNPEGNPTLKDVFVAS